MTVGLEFDRGIRARLAAHFSHAPIVLDLGVCDTAANVWRVSPGSPAHGEQGINTNMFTYLAPEIDDLSLGMNLPLTQARALLMDAAWALEAVGIMTTQPEARVRFAAIAPLARSATERAATVVWVIGGRHRNQRLRRALLVEIRGLDHLMAYLPTIRKDSDDRDLRAMRRRLLEIADSEAGGHVLDKRGRLLSIGGETTPRYGDLVTQATGPTAYPELSVHTHPTGYLHAASSEWSGGGGGHRQASFVVRSTVHDEGRLCEPAVLSFGKALALVAGYIGVVHDQAVDWVREIAATWGEWCTENGCV